MTTAAYSPLSAPLSFVTAETALAAYQMACTTGEPDSYEAAAHALAGALKAERARRMAPRPGAGAGPRLVVDNDPTPQSARPTAKPARKSAPMVADLDAPLPAAKRGSPAGSFLIEWSDGSTTRVQGLAWPAAKPATRWARAYQAGNRVRRLRHARELQPELTRTAVVEGHRDTLSGGIAVDSAAWRELVAVMPLPALVGIVDETTGERFAAPEGTAFGAGDRVRACAVEASLCRPFLPWLAADVARSHALWNDDHRDGVVYVVRRMEGDAEVGGVACASPWPDAYRRQVIRDAEMAFALPVETVAEAEVVAGERLNATTADEIEGLTLTTTAEQVEVAALAARKARADFEAERISRCDMTAAEARAEVLAVIAGHAWTARRGPGGIVKLQRTGHGVVLSPAALPSLHRVA